MTKHTLRQIERFLYVILFTVSFFAVMGWAGYLESTYDMQGTVLNKVDNIWIIEDARGHLWEYEDSDLKKGQNVKIVFFDNHTHAIYDDEIVKIKVSKS